MAKVCQYCNKREAKIHFTEIKDGKKTEMHICESCAHEKNMVLAFPSLLSHIVKGGPATPRAESEAVPATCPSCGLAYTDFKSKGRLGCPTCYEVFAPVLVPLLEKVHGTAAHAGKAPERMATMIASKKEVLALEEELEQAIQAEEYERAAELRDRIRSHSEGTDDDAAEGDRA
ncbi:MAG: UvrB/UvrC motif-containing protein [Planctomycetota bacterium]|nr:UvrB/UvrC motif-containing protein [Planctomycetota bacterium]